MQCQGFWRIEGDFWYIKHDPDAGAGAAQLADCFEESRRKGGGIFASALFPVGCEDSVGDTALFDNLQHGSGPGWTTRVKSRARAAVMAEGGDCGTVSSDEAGTSLLLTSSGDHRYEGHGVAVTPEQNTVGCAGGLLADFWQCIAESILCIVLPGA